ncbi:MAG: histidine kinase [Verrucomicrobiia bacterium]
MRGLSLRQFLGLLVVVMSVPAWGRAEGDVLTSIEAIRNLPPAEADRGLPVQVSGVVTYLEPNRPLAFIQNGPHAIYVSPPFVDALNPEVPLVDLAVGDKVEVTGITMAGGFAPAIRARPGESVRVRREGRMGLPGPIRPPRGNLLDPSLDCLWVEVEGLVRHVGVHRDRLLIEVASGRTIFTVIVPGKWTEESAPKHLTDASVRVRGVFGSITNERRQLVGLRLYSPFLRLIQVLDGGADKLWNRRPLGVEELMQFRQSTAERVRIQGYVTAVFPGEGIFVRTNDGSIRVTTPQAASVKVGQWVDAVGFFSMDGPRPALEDAILQPGPEGAAPEPVALRPAQLLEAARHGELVSVRATLIDRFSREGETLLLLGDGARTFTAQLPASELPGKIPLQSLVQLTGVALIQSTLSPPEPGLGDRRQRVSSDQSFSLALRDPGDITLLRRPPFWTQERILAAVLVLAISLLLLIVWLVVLRRKVQSQTRIISEKAANEYVLEERARIARELHDTLEQELAGIGLQLDLARSRLGGSDPRMLRPVELALRMLRRCQHETRRSIANLRSVQLDHSDLATALKDMAEEQSSPGGPKISVQVSGAPVKLPAPGEQHLLRLFQEALTNARKHANAQNINLRLQYAPDQVVAEIRDDGCGFNLAEGQSREGHFGLRGMQERAAKLGAELKVETSPGGGTRISLALPLRPRKLRRSEFVSTVSSP